MVDNNQRVIQFQTVRQSAPYGVCWHTIAHISKLQLWKRIFHSRYFLSKKFVVVAAFFNIQRGHILDSFEINLMTQRPVIAGMRMRLLRTRIISKALNVIEKWYGIQSAR